MAAAVGSSGFVSAHRAKIFENTDVRNTIMKPMTVPDGWVNTPIVTDVAKVWYSHKYHREGQPVQAPWEEGDRCFIC
jgi:hypothetical protein